MKFGYEQTHSTENHLQPKDIEKKSIHDFWNNASCGEDLYLGGLTKQDYNLQSAERYRLEPYIETFARFAEAKQLRVLEIGIGLGADHQRFAEAGAELFGIDLTSRAINHTSCRLQAFGLTSVLSIGDAEILTFDHDFFDLVYSWGVLHHTPSTDKAVAEVFRVLKTGGIARIMIYHKWSFVGLMLWFRYGLLHGKPWTSLKSIYGKYLESPGTKAYSFSEATKLMHQFRDVQIRTVLTHGDLLSSHAGQRHQGLLLHLARSIWPRWFIQKLFPRAGLFMLIQATK